MNLASSRQKQLVITSPNLNRAHCEHINVLAYDLSAEDQADFCRRLNTVLQTKGNCLERDSSEFSLNFLTPSIRGQRAKSMLTTTRASKNVASTAGSGGYIDEWSPADDPAVDDHSSAQKNRSNTRRRISKNKLPAPTIFRNCADCGGFYINVSSCL